MDNNDYIIEKYNCVINYTVQETIVKKLGTKINYGGI